MSAFLAVRSAPDQRPTTDPHDTFWGARSALLLALSEDQMNLRTTEAMDDAFDRAAAQVAAWTGPNRIRVAGRVYEIISREADQTPPTEQVEPLTVTIRGHLAEQLRDAALAEDWPLQTLVAFVASQISDLANRGLLVPDGTLPEQVTDDLWSFCGTEVEVR